MTLTEIKNPFSETDKEMHENWESLIEEGYDSEEMKEFMEEHGQIAWYGEYENYCHAVTEFDQHTVDSFLEVFEIEDISHLGDAYMGYHESGAAFAESFVTDMGYIQNDLPYWIAIDWEETWSNLEYDYTESNGYIFSNNW